MVRYKRENVTPAASAANTPEKGTPKESFETARESFSEVKEDEDGQEESSPAPVSVATLASRYVVVEPEVDEEEKEKDGQPPSTSPAVKPPVHRKPRSKVKTKPRDQELVRGVSRDAEGSRSRRRPRRPTRRKRRMRSRRCSKRKSQSRIRRPGGEGEKHPRARFARAMTSASSVCATATSWSCTRDPVTTSRGPRGTR